MFWRSLPPVVLCCLVASSSTAQDFYTGPAGGSWGATINWSNNVLPSPAVDAYLGYSNIGVLRPFFIAPVNIHGINASARYLKMIAPLDMQAGQLDLYGDLICDPDARNANASPKIEMRSSRLFFQTSADIYGADIRALNGINYLDIWTGQTLTNNSGSRIDVGPGAILRQSTFFYRPGIIVNRGVINSLSELQLTPSEFYNLGDLTVLPNGLGSVDTTRANLEIATQFLYNQSIVYAVSGNMNFYSPEALNSGTIRASGLTSTINLFVPEVHHVSGELSVYNSAKMNISGNLHLSGNGVVDVVSGKMTLGGDLYAYGQNMTTYFPSGSNNFEFRIPSTNVVRTVRYARAEPAFYEGLNSRTEGGATGYVRLSNCTTSAPNVNFSGKKIIIDGFDADKLTINNSEIAFPGYRQLPSSLFFDSGVAFILLNPGQKLAHRLFGSSNNQIQNGSLYIEGPADSEFQMGNCEITAADIHLRGGTKLVRIIGPVNVYSTGYAVLPPISISRRGSLLFEERVLQPYSISTEASTGAILNVVNKSTNPLPGWQGRVTINPGTTLSLRTETGGLTGIMNCTTMLINGHLDLSQVNPPLSPAGTILKLINGEVILGPKFTYGLPPGWSLSNGPSGVWLRKN